MGTGSAKPWKPTEDETAKVRKQLIPLPDRDSLKAAARGLADEFKCEPHEVVQLAMKLSKEAVKPPGPAQ